MLKLIERVLDIVFPRYCLVTARPGAYLSPWARRTALSLVVSQSCHVCGDKIAVKHVHTECRSLSWLDGVIVVSKHEGVARDMIHRFKYGFSHALRVELAELMYMRFMACGVGLEDLYVSWVPTTRARRWQRGYNQSFLLAQAVARLLNVPTFAGLRRRGHEGSQVGKSRQERLLAMKEVFTVPGRVPERILLVDDVFTTGATLETCAKTLKESGAREVYALVVAHGN